MSIRALGDVTTRSLAGAHAPRATHATREVAARRTPLSIGEIRKALATAHLEQTGRPASAATLDVLTAQVAHETARGDRMFNFNFGGIKGASPQGTTARYTTHERTPAGDDVTIVDKFRAYATPAEGARDYLALLRTRYGSAMEAAERGDATGFATALKARGYYTAPVSDYASALRHLAREARTPGVPRGGVDRAAPRAEGPSFAARALDFAPSQLGADGTVPAPLPTTVELVRVLDAVAALSARIGAPTDEGNAA